MQCSHAEDDKLDLWVNINADAVGFQRRARESVARWCSRSQCSGPAIRHVPGRSGQSRPLTDTRSDGSPFRQSTGILGASHLRMRECEAIQRAQEHGQARVASACSMAAHAFPPGRWLLTTGIDCGIAVLRYCDGAWTGMHESPAVLGRIAN